MKAIHTCRPHAHRETNIPEGGRLSFLFLLLFIFSNTPAHACPIWKLGNIRVTDEKGNDLVNAVIWRVYTQKDSFRMRRGEQYLFRSDSGVRDTSFFELWAGGMMRPRSLRQSGTNPFKPYYRVQAPGYADLVIQQFDFSKRRDEDSPEPTIKLVMYPSLYLRKGNEYIRISEFRLDKADAGKKDTTAIGLTEYTRSLKQETPLQTIKRKEAARVSTYPSPARDFIRIEIRDSMPLPYQAFLYDLSGRCLSEMQLTESLNSLSLLDLSPAIYILTVRSHTGEILYCIRFNKE